MQSALKAVVHRFPPTHLLVILFVCIAGTTAVSAAEPDFTSSDAHVATIPAPASDDIPALVKKLVGPARSDVERVRAIARWLALNIEYDHDTHRDGVSQLKAGKPPMWVFPFNEPKAVRSRLMGSAWQDAMRSTSERRLAKQQRHEVVCCVKTTNFCRPGGAVP